MSSQNFTDQDLGQITCACWYLEGDLIGEETKIFKATRLCSWGKQLHTVNALKCTKESCHLMMLSHVVYWCNEPIFKEWDVACNCQIALRRDITRWYSAIWSMPGEPEKCMKCMILAFLLQHDLKKQQGFKSLIYPNGQNKSWLALYLDQLLGLIHKGISLCCLSFEKACVIIF